MTEVKFIGDEFYKDEAALLEGKYTVTVIKWDKRYGGWWCVRLQNGGIHYTRLLSKKEKSPTFA